MKKKSYLNSVFVFLLIGFWLGLPAAVSGQESFDPGFDAGYLISDAAFADTGTFGTSAGLQQFLESRGSLLADTRPEFLALLREPGEDLKVKLDDPKPNLGRLRTAAELIYDASRSAGLNPQVIVVTLHKEQSLITGKFAGAELQTRLDRSLGYGCPDNQPCQASFLGFYNQLFGAVDAAGDRWIGAPKALMRSFNYAVAGVRIGRGPLIDVDAKAYGSGPFVRASRQGDTIVLENTLGGFAGVPSSQFVNLKNFATAALYRYTPHVFNGNYNFWRYYNAWFKYPNGSVVKLLDAPELWLIENGRRYTFSSFVASQRGINSTSPILVSPTELQNYLDGGKLWPLEGTLIRPEGEQVVYIVSGAQKRALTYEVFKQRRLNFADVAVLAKAEVDEIPLGTLMPPLSDTLVKAPGQPAVYWVAGESKRIISYAVFKQRNFSFANVVTVAPANISQLKDDLPLPPLEGTLVKAADNPTVYQVRGGLKIAITGTIFKLRQYKFSQVLTLSDSEVSALAAAAFALPPKDGTLVRAADNPTVYLVQSEKLRPVTYSAFVARKFKFSQVIVFDPAELAFFEKGESLIK